MTLVIVGHEKAVDKWTWTGNSRQSQPVRFRNDGLFAVSDSVITTHGSGGDTPILSGLRKIHAVPVKLWQPYFVGSYFRAYHNVYHESECLVAFSGSTLTATHAIDLISEHLGRLQISYKLTRKYLEPGKYIVQRHCQHNDLRDTNEVIEWGDDMFLPSDFEGLLTAEYISA